MKTLILILTLACASLAVAQLIRTDINLTPEQTAAMESQRANHNSERARTNGPALTQAEFLAVRAVASVDTASQVKDQERLRQIIIAIRTATPAKRNAILSAAEAEAGK